MIARSCIHDHESVDVSVLVSFGSQELEPPWFFGSEIAAILNYHIVFCPLPILDQAELSDSVQIPHPPRYYNSRLGFCWSPR